MPWFGSSANYERKGQHHGRRPVLDQHGATGTPTKMPFRELLDRQVMGWDAGDPEDYASVFTADADYVTFLGSHYKGREALAASYAPLFKKLLKGSRLNTEITQLRFLTPDVALIQRK